MISIVIPHFDDFELLASHLPRLKGLLGRAKIEYEVLVVDDCSPKTIGDQLRKLGTKYPEVTFVYKERNEGFAATVDAGIRKARGKYVFVLKNDVLPERADFFKLMLNHFSHKDVFSVAAALKTTEEGKVELRGQGIIIFYRGFFLHFRNPTDYEKWLGTMRLGRLFGSKRRLRMPAGLSLWADGGAQVLRKDYYLRIGGFDKIYEFYWEDADLGYRAWKAGYKIHFEARAILTHEHTEGVIGKKYSKEFLQELNQRNQFIFVWKNSDLKHLLLYQLWEPYNHLIALKNRDTTWIRAYWRAMILWPRIVFSRWRQRAVSRLSDDQVLDLVSEQE